MIRASLGLAIALATLLSAAPASALDRDRIVSGGAAVPRFHGCGGGRHGDRHHGDGCRTDVVLDWYGGDWARYNNRSFEPDSYNDWWHDRPDRAFPRWVQHNQDCTPDRMWWSGNGWHC
jgi:hypothetical protein